MNDTIYDVITVGSNTIDSFVYTDRVESMSMRTVSSESKFICYPLGSKLRINELDFYTGGGGTNTAVCFARLGFKTGYAGKLGDDINGKTILEELKKENVDFLGKVSREHKTGFSIVLDSIERNRTILTHRGANDFLKPEELDILGFKTKWFHFSAMVKGSYATLEQISEYAKDNRINICFNPNNYLCERGTGFLKKILSNTKILILNDEEASLLVKNGSIKSKLSSLKEYGPEIVIITDGVKPIYCIDGKDMFYTVYPLDIEIVETTGAGDSFSSSFLAGFIRTADVTFALRLAITNSHSVLRHKGAKNILLDYEQAKAEMTKSPVRIDEGLM